MVQRLLFRGLTWPGHGRASDIVSEPSIAVFGICPERDAAEAALDTLRSAGFRNTDISILFSDGKADVAPAMIGWLSGVGALSVPGSGPLIAAGPVMGMLDGARISGVSAGVIGALRSLGVLEYEARRYEQRMRNGGVLVCVHCEGDEWERRARSVLDQHDAEFISRGWEGTAARSAASSQEGS